MSQTQRIRDFVLFCGVGNLLEEYGIKAEEVFEEGEFERTLAVAEALAPNYEPLENAAIKQEAINIFRGAVARLLAEVTQSDEETTPAAAD